VFVKKCASPLQKAKVTDASVCGCKISRTRKGKIEIEKSRTRKGKIKIEKSRYEDGTISPWRAGHLVLGAARENDAELRLVKRGSGDAWKVDLSGVGALSVRGCWSRPYTWPLP